MSDATEVVDTLTNMRAASILHNMRQHKRAKHATKHRDRRPVTVAIRKKRRRPNAAEIDRGLPADFKVEEIPRKSGAHVDKYFYSPAGKKYRSIAAVRRAQEDSSSSVSAVSHTDMPCVDDDTFAFTVSLNIYANDKYMYKRKYASTDTVQKVIDDVLPGGTLFYHGVGRDVGLRLQCVFEDMVPNGEYKVHIRNKPGLHTFVFRF